MTDTAIPTELRPRDFTARLARDAGPLRARPARGHLGRRLAVLAAAIAVPAMAQGPFAAADWHPALAEPRGDTRPLGFEVPGESFPGSAFYYLDDLPNLRNPAGQPPADVAELALPRPSVGGLDPGPAARALALAGNARDRARAHYCLALAVYYEAASESDAGQRAVAQVVLNRVAHPSYPDTVCGVVFQGSERATGCQFSFTCDGSLARRPAQMWWDRAAQVARAALAGAVYAPVGLATHYHTVQVDPYWADSLEGIGTIGAHRFYRWRGAAGQATAFSDRYRGGEPAAIPHPRAPQAVPATEGDPLLLARAYEQALESVQAAAPLPAPAPAYSAAIAARGGEALFRASIPAAGQVRPEYAHSGQWLRQP